MVEKLIMGIAQALRTVFPEEIYKIYTESVEQDFEEPCFFILCVTQGKETQLGDRFLSKSSFDVHYFPKNGNIDCWEKESLLQEVLEWISLEGSLVHGAKMNGRIEDGVLHFFVDYNIHMTRRKEPESYMEEVRIYGEIK